MARGEFLDYDPNSGLSYYHAEEDGKTIIHSMQDVEPVLKRAEQKRHMGLSDKGIGGDGHMKEYCYLPMSIMLELKKKGINMMNPSPGDWKRFFYEIETNYPMLKTTEKKGWRPK
jgi:hypothetical protein